MERTFRYDRAPSEHLAAEIEHGVLVALRDQLHIDFCGERLPLDPHFREDDAVSLYAGQSAVLTIKRRRGALVASAHKTYASQPCAAPLLGKRWLSRDSGELATALGSYLAAVRVGAQWITSEGRVQLRWHGRDPSARGRPPWAPVDREVVLGRGSGQATHDEVLAAAHEAVDQVARANGWPRPPRRSAQNEVDLLAVADGGRRVVLVELKPAGAVGAEHAPLQVFRYLREWQAAWASPARHELHEGLRRVILARRRAGWAHEDIELDPNAALSVAIAFDRAPTTKRRQQIAAYLAALAPFDPSGALAGIELLAWPDGERGPVDLLAVG